MGFDAMAVRPGEKKWICDSHKTNVPTWSRRLMIGDKKLRRAFGEAARRVYKKTRGADGDLRLGGLCLRASGYALRMACWEAIRQNRNFYEWWPAEFVREAAATANWNDEDIRREDSGYQVEDVHIESAREFLNTCARHNLEIKFSY